MSDKKGLSAFLQKQRKKPTKQSKPSAGPAVDNDVAEQAQAQDDKVAQSQDQIPAKKTNKDDSSEEEEDEVQGLSYGNIKEKKDVASAKQQDENIRAGYGFDDNAEQKPGAAGADGTEVSKQKKTAADIKFGGPRPKFGRGTRGKFGGEFSEGLDDLDDDGTVKKKPKDTKQANESTAAADGAREFVNLGASARAGGQRDPEEEKKTERQPGVKPTFRGKLNLTKTGGGHQEEENVGVVTNYGFNVALRGPRTDDKQEKEEGKEGDDHRPRKENRRNRDKGQPFSAAQNNKDDDDDGFELVQDRDGKRRQNRQRQQQQGDSDSDDGFTTTRGGFRGNRGGRGGRGGFFKNSRRTAASEKD